MVRHFILKIWIYEGSTPFFSTMVIIYIFIKGRLSFNIYVMIKINYEDIEEAINSTETMAEAAKKLNMSFSTFKRKCIKFNLYNPNQGRKGIKREEYEDDGIRLSLDKILKGEFPFYPTNNLRKRLLKVGIKENKCEECNLIDWKNKDIVCQLDHIDGNSTNHKLENLRMLCPNCHSQTLTYSGRNKKNKEKYTKDDFIKSVNNSKNYEEVKRKLNLSSTGNNNDTIRKLMEKYELSFKK